MNRNIIFREEVFPFKTQEDKHKPIFLDTLSQFAEEEYTLPTSNIKDIRSIANPVEQLPQGTLDTQEHQEVQEELASLPVDLIQLQIGIEDQPRPLVQPTRRSTRGTHLLLG